MSLGSYMCLNFWISSFTVEPLCVVSLTLSLSYRDKMWSAATTEQHPGWFLWFEGGKNKTMHKQNFSECILELKSHCNRYATGTKKWSALQHCDVVFFLSFFFFFFSWLCCCCYSYLDCAVKRGETSSWWCAWVRGKDVQNQSTFSCSSHPWRGRSKDVYLKIYLKWVLRST